ncbi:MAG: hypothetical protein F6K24_27800 [Okeania sp. SIO2D1]|nr:hypothetical protein [Okeania sp. SIO2D1]
MKTAVIQDCSVAVAGAAFLGIAGTPGVTTNMPTSATTLGVFGLSGLR